MRVKEAVPFAGANGLEAALSVFPEVRQPAAFSMSGHRHSQSDPPGPPDDGADAPVLDPERDLPGAVFMVPNAHWGFEVVSADDHPGACVHYFADRRDGGVMLKGTDADNVRRYQRFYWNVEPTAENGLDKLTAFHLVPRYFRLRRLLTYFPERRIGRLDGETLRILREELARLNPEE
jgi:hypothetical protein